MNKKWLVAGALAVILIAVLITAAFSSSNSVCKQVITGAQKGQAQETYELFTAQAQTLTTPAQWNTIVKGLQSAYRDAKVVSVSSTPDPNADATAPATKEVYTVGEGNYAYTATCTIQSKKVNTFTSEPKI